MPQCSHCGNELPEMTQHCPNCGRSPAASPTAPELIPVKPVNTAAYFRTGWEMFKRYPEGFVGYFVIYLVIEIILNLIPIIGPLASFIVSPPLFAGIIIVSARVLHNQQPEMRDFFTGFSFFLPVFLVTLVTSIFIGVGLVLLLIPGIYLMVAYMFTPYLVIDRRLDFWQAMDTSRRLVHPHWFGFFLFFLWLLLLNLAGALCLGVGLLITTPLTVCIMTAAYGDFCGWQSSYSGKVPSLGQSATP